MKNTLLNKGFLLLIPFALMAALTMDPVSAFGQDKKEASDNEKITSQAFDALNAEKFPLAINKAEECIKRFRRTAEEMQRDLKATNAPMPAIGKVEDQKEREKIFDRGPLNDVAACYFILGEAHMKLAEVASGSEKRDRLNKAKAAYESAAKFTYARTWDERGWFWPPAKTANEKLQDMEPIR